MYRRTSLKPPAHLAGANVDCSEIARQRIDVEKFISQNWSAAHPTVNTGLPERFLRTSPCARGLSAAATVVTKQSRPLATTHYSRPRDEGASVALASTQHTMIDLFKVRNAQTEFARSRYVMRLAI